MVFVKYISEKLNFEKKQAKLPSMQLTLTEIYQCRNVFVLFVFVALRPMSTAMVIAGQSVHLTTLFPGQA